MYLNVGFGLCGKIQQRKFFNVHIQTICMSDYSSQESELQRCRSILQDVWKLGAVEPVEHNPGMSDYRLVHEEPQEARWEDHDSLDRCLYLLREVQKPDCVEGKPLAHLTEHMDSRFFDQEKVAAFHTAIEGYFTLYGNKTKDMDENESLFGDNSLPDDEERKIELDRYYDEHIEPYIVESEGDVENLVRKARRRFAPPPVPLTDEERGALERQVKVHVFGRPHEFPKR